MIDRDEIAQIIGDTDSHVLLYGPRGTGKTTLAKRATTTGQKLISITMTAEMSKAEIMGHYIPEGGDFKWHNGPGVDAWKEGAILNINEIDHVSEDASNILHALLDDFEVARLTLPNNETIVPEIGFRVIATMNGTPDDLNEAVLDRFGIILPVDSPSEEMLNLLQEDTRVACIKEYRSAVKVNSSPEITYRILHNFDKHRAKLGDLKAAQAVFPSKAGVQGFVEALVLNRRELAQ